MVVGLVHAGNLRWGKGRSNRQKIKWPALKSRRLTVQNHPKPSKTHHPLKYYEILITSTKLWNYVLLNNLQNAIKLYTSVIIALDCFGILKPYPLEFDRNPLANLYGFEHQRTGLPLFTGSYKESHVLTDVNVFWFWPCLILKTGWIALNWIFQFGVS